MCTCHRWRSTSQARTNQTIPCGLHPAHVQLHDLVRLCFKAPDLLLPQFMGWGLGARVRTAGHGWQGMAWYGRLLAQQSVGWRGSCAQHMHAWHGTAWQVWHSVARYGWPQWLPCLTHPAPPGNSLSSKQGWLLGPPMVMTPRQRLVHRPGPLHCIAAVRPIAAVAGDAFGLGHICFHRPNDRKQNSMCLTRNALGM